MRRAGLFEAEEHDACLAVARPLNVEGVHLLADGAEHLVRRVRGRGEHDRTPQKIASSARGEDLRVDVAPRREKPVSAKFGGCLRGVGGEGLRKRLRRGGRFAKRTGTGDRIGIGVVVPLLVAGNAAQLHRRPQKRHVADGADRGVRGVPEVLGGEDALGSELERQTPPYAPYLLNGQGGEDFRRIARHEEHAIGTLLPDVVGDLGERLRGREADAARDADPAEYLGADAPSVCGVVCGGGRGWEDKRLVDGVLLHVHGLLAEDRDDAARHIAVELVVGRAEAQLARRLAGLEMEVGRAHRDAERLELV